MEQSPQKIRIMVITYKRPAGLGRLLDALARQQFDDEKIAVDCLVVDNDAAGSSKREVDSKRGELPFPIHYAIEPQQGIPVARNRALAESNAFEWVIFVDDDERPDPQWLDYLVATQKKEKPDAVAGPVVPSFDDSVPPWIIDGRFFNRQRYRTGTRLEHAFTGNILFRHPECVGPKLHFDETMTGGGSDREFFSRYTEAGAVVVWCDEAVVHEDIPRERATVAWLVKRMRRVGLTTAQIQRQPYSARRSVIEIFSRGLVWCGIGSVQWLAGIIIGKAYRVRGRCSLAYGRGLVQGVLGYRQREYV